MKCQQCERPATFHITELTGGKPQELHLCEDHARSYLTSSSGGEPAGAGGMAAALAAASAADGHWANSRRTGPPRPAGLSGVRDHFLRIPQPGPPGLPSRLCGLPNPIGTLDHECSWRVGTRRQATPPRTRQQRTADAVDPHAARNEGSGRERELRACLRTPRSDSTYRNRAGILTIENGGNHGVSAKSRKRKK